MTTVKQRLTTQEEKFSSSSGLLSSYATQEASVSGIPGGGYYIINTVAKWENGSVKEGVQIAYGYFGTGKIYIRSFANSAVSFDWREM